MEQMRPYIKTTNDEPDKRRHFMCEFYEAPIMNYRKNDRFIYVENYQLINPTSETRKIHFFLSEDTFCDKQKLT